MAKGGTVMRYFFTLLRLRIKAGAASRTFLLTAVCFLALSAVLSAALPDSSRMSLEVGLVAEGERAERVTARLMQNEDYRFIRYPGQEAAEQAVLAGKLHCGYLLGAEEPPIIALSTRSAYMRPLIDEIVFAAWFEEEMPVLAAERLTQNGFSDAQAHADFERLREEAEPMTVVLRQSGGRALDTLAESSVQPLLYAALVSAGYSEEAALGTVVSEFGSMEEICQSLGYQANGPDPYLQVEYEEFRMLLTGDVTGASEDELLLELEGREPLTVLKVAHHGSKYSTPQELLELTKPVYAVISAGKDNRYGHPHEELMERLKRQGSHICQTPEGGAVTMQVRNGRIRVEEFTDGKNKT